MVFSPATERQDPACSATPPALKTDDPSENHPRTQTYSVPHVRCVVIMFLVN